ncbi:MAG: hypothetical protein IPL48_15855 [Bacteroidetes bacterium]|nr:hypothetical protein [Bacteroidota bacterium]
MNCEKLFRCGCNQLFARGYQTQCKKFLEIVNPQIALFVKYEFWFHYLSTLHQQEIPIILFSSIFRKEQIFFKWYGLLFRKMLGYFDKIFVQTIASKNYYNPYI